MELHVKIIDNISGFTSSFTYPAKSLPCGWIQLKDDRGRTVQLKRGYIEVRKLYNPFRQTVGGT